MYGHQLSKLIALYSENIQMAIRKYELELEKTRVQLKKNEETITEQDLPFYRFTQLIEESNQLLAENEISMAEQNSLIQKLNVLLSLLRKMRFSIGKVRKTTEEEQLMKEMVSFFEDRGEEGYVKILQDHLEEEMGAL